MKRNKHVMSGMLFWAAAFCAGAYLIVGIVVNQVSISSKQQSLDSVQQQLEQQQAENEELQRLLTGGSEEEIVERVARDRLGYARPDERVFVDVSGS